MRAVVTGERAVTAAGGFNPAWQRHVAGYRLTGRFLPQGRIVDIGCGVGHSYRLLEPRETVGVDIEPAVLSGQERETVVADMRDLPFGNAEFDGAISAHAIEHVPDPERALAETSRVLASAGAAVFVTPNRLTFARPDEIIDPYHYLEFDPAQLAALCGGFFSSVELLGVFGSARYDDFVAGERVKLDSLLRKDPLRLRRFVPRGVRQRLYDRRLTAERADTDPGAEAITEDDFTLSDQRLDAAHDLVAVCRTPLRRGG